MHYLSVAEARNRRGLRLVLSAGVPGPWGEAAKAIFSLRQVPFVAVEQLAMEANEDLVAWTGHRNAPIACFDDEPPLTLWLDQLLLAERLGTGASLIPDDERERALCLGFSTEIAGRGGLGWNRRLEMMATSVGPVEDAAPDGLRTILHGYGVSREAIAQATARQMKILTALSGLLGEASGRPRFFLGSQLSALDIYWACFSMLLRPLPAEVNPMPDWLRPIYTNCDPQILAALDPALIEHRDRIYAEHIGLPLDF